MAIDTTRAEVRKAWAAILVAGLTGVGEVVQAVHNYRIGKFETQPIVIVASGGTERTPFVKAGSRASYILEVWIITLYAELDNEGKLALHATTGLPLWDEAIAEDTVDLIEHQIRALVDANQSNAQLWKAVGYAGPSQSPQVENIGGTNYLCELIRLRFETF